MIARCLDDDTIAAVLEGALAPAGAQAVRAHLAGCDACRELVAASLREEPSATAPTEPAPRAVDVEDAIRIGGVLAGRYRIDRLVGSGGMGRVYAAHQLDLDRPVALKVLRPSLASDPAALARFQREARLVAGLMSEHVVRIHDIGTLENGAPFLAMELLAGEDLSAVVARGPVPIAQAIAWIAGACDALAEAHALGVVHRDVKPQNLFLARVAGEPRLKLLDFGIAKLSSPQPGATALTQTGHLVGSPLYMAPEQTVWGAPVDARADVWALGVTLFHLVTGRPPFDGTLEDVLSGIRSRHPPPLGAIRPDVPPALSAIVERCLAKDPAARFPSAAALRQALAFGSSALGPPVAPRPARALWPLLLAGAIVVLVGGLGATLLLRSTLRAPVAASRPVAVGRYEEARVRTRLETLGYTIGLVSREDYGTGCRWNDLGVTKEGRSGHVFLWSCTSDARAEDEARRLGKFASGWTVRDGSSILFVDLGDAAASRTLSDALVSS